jgi:hypothetical protein
MTTIPKNLFPQHLNWTEETCYYAAANQGCRMAYLAGPYRTSEEAAAALPIARKWAVHSSGDPVASGYQYAVSVAYNGHSRSILGELRPPSFAFGCFDDYEISPCRRHEEPDSPGRFYYETCRPTEADVWTLYGHIPGRGVEAIGDFDNFEHAAGVYARITGKPYA